VSGSATVRIGVDTGGTFTDVVVADARGVRSFKVPSTPADPSRAILAGLDAALGGATGAELLHGTTVGTNTLLERTGARTAFVTTAGFEDTLATGRQARPRLYDLGVRRPEPLVPPELCFGVAERVAADGTVLVEPDPRALDALARAVADSGAESVAVSLLFAFASPDHEREVEARLEALGLPVSASHRILPEYREYERAATIAVNAYLLPRMRGYLERLDREARSRGVSVLRVMQSSGGSISAATAGREPVRTILSGPAGGAVAAARLAAAGSLGDLVTFDMGGTSTDVALVAGGAARVTGEAHVADLPVAVPVVDIHTVGAGGGSIASVDAGGALRVGPESAGADPGPACYGRGDRATVTDANVVLGRLAGLLGGSMALDAERARAALERLAADISAASGRPCSPEDAALGVVRVASANMERALRVVSVERGYDPRGASLLSFGGAGGLHACELAAALGMRRVVVPPFPGAFSALGLLLGDVVRDVGRTVLGAATTDEALEAVYRDLEAEARAALVAEGVPPDRTAIERTAALRYAGQSYEIEVAWSDGGRDAFHAAHRARYGHADERRPVEVVHLRVRGIGRSEPLDLPRAAASPHEAAPSGTTRVRFAAGWLDVPVFERELLAAGARAAGPALVNEYGSTTLVPDGWALEVDEYGNLVVRGQWPVVSEEENIGCSQTSLPVTSDH
jgi:N-methylhydantoinase A